VKNWSTKGGDHSIMELQVFTSGMESTGIQEEEMFVQK